MISEYKLVFTEAVKKDINNLNKSILKIIFSKLEVLAKNPELGKPLGKDLKGFFKLKISKYRVVYKLERDKLIILILAIAPRKDDLVYDIVKKRIMDILNK